MDNCQVCLGARGGVKGNENVVFGIVACDCCSVLLRDVVRQRIAELEKRVEELEREKTQAHQQWMDADKEMVERGRLLRAAEAEVRRLEGLRERNGRQALCMSLSCHLMREHTAEECGHA